MNNSEETRLCKKCGKRLPSSNNFCMYCGCNNNLNDDELEALKDISSNNIHTQSKQELLNKGIAAKDRELVIGGKSSSIKKDSKKTSVKNVRSKDEKIPLTSKLIYVFMILDVIALSIILMFNMNGLLFEAFKYDLNDYDTVVNIKNTSFLGLKNNKITVMSEDEDLNGIDFEKINNEKVLGIAEDDDYNGKTIYIETKKNFYTITGVTFDLDEEENEKPSDDFYKDLNTNLLDKESKDDEYYTILGNTNYIKDGSLYKTVSDKTSIYDYYGRYSNSKKSNYYDYKSTYHSEIVLNSINMDDPEILFNSPTGNSVIIKGKDEINVYTEGVLIQSINKVTANGRTYNISDFKYILFEDSKFLFVRNNGATIEYYYDNSIINVAEMYGPDSRKFRSKYPNQLNLNVNVDNSIKSDEFSASITDSNYKQLAKSFLDFSNFNKNDILILIAILVAIALFFYELYRFRVASFIVATLTTTALFFVYYTILQIVGSVVFSSIDNFKLMDFLKTLMLSIPGLFVISWYITQLRSIVNYITFKFNIETVYHFILMFIGVSCFLTAVGLFTNNLVFIIVLPGLVYGFMALNDEDYIEYNIDSKTLIELFATLFISLAVGFGLCLALKLCQYYLFIIVVAFAIACFIVMFDSDSLFDHIRRCFLSFGMLFMIIAYIIISGIVTIARYISAVGFEGLGKTLKLYFGLTTVLTIYVIYIALVIAITVFLLKVFTAPLTYKIKNRILKIFIYTIVMVLVVVGFILLLPQLNTMLFRILACLFDIQDYLSSFNLFSVF